MTTILRFVLTAWLASLCASAWPQVQDPDDAVAAPLDVPAGDPAAIQAGKERYSERCAFCHGGAGRGAKGPCLTCDRFRHGGSNRSLYNTIAAGLPRTQMGAFGTTLSGEEILNIIAYLRSETQRRREAGELEP
jgi:mono/diheme cytochrome c family protein